MDRQKWVHPDRSDTALVQVKAGLLLYEICVQRRARNPVPEKVLKVVVGVGLALGGILITRGRGGVPVPR